MAINYELAAKVIAGIATAWACIASTMLIRDHLANWKNPKTQKLIIYIIVMVPLFAIDSFIGLCDIEASETLVMVLDSVKECYEAWVLMSFLSLMFAYLQVEVGKIPDELKGKHLHQTVPFNWCMKDMVLDINTVKTLHNWTLQFIVLRPILSVLSVILELSDNYDDSNWATIINIILNISVTVAVYALMMFYHAFARELSPHRPLAQFLCIKGVVAFAFWQGVILSLLVKFKIVHASHWYTTDEIDDGIQNFLVCVEMGAIFSFAHNYAFAADEYKAGYVAPPLPPAEKEDEHHKSH